MQTMMTYNSKYDHQVFRAEIKEPTSLAIGKGGRSCGVKKRMIFSLEQERLDTDMCDSKRTSIIAEIANLINNNIQVTTDYPEANSN